MTTHHRSLVTLVACVLASVAAVACADRTAGPITSLVPLPALEHDGVRGAIVADSISEGRAVYSLVLDSRGMRLGAFQGEVRFDSSTLTLSSTSTTNNGFAMLNTEAARQGLIRFAGFSDTGTTTMSVARLAFDRLGPIDPTSVRIYLDVVATEHGIKVGDSSVVAERKAYLGRVIRTP